MWTRHVETRLSLWAEGALPGPEARAVETHLASCARCRSSAQEVHRGLALARRLRPEPLPDERSEAILAALRRATPETRPLRWRPPVLAAGAATAAGLVAAVRFLSVGPPPEEVAPPSALRVVPAVERLSPFEDQALTVHGALSVEPPGLDLETDSPEEARGWARAEAGVDVSLATDRPVEDRGRYELRGVRKVRVDGGGAVAVAYRVDGRPVTLLAARSEDVADGPPHWSASTGKTVSLRGRDGVKVLTWTNSGNTYALVSDLPGHGQQACFVCHTDPGRRRMIRDLHL